jgi:large subunit ribosomal protein L29
MEIAKIRNMSDEELKHQEKTSGEQLFRLRFQVALGQNDGVKKLRELRREIAQIKTIARERELGIHDEVKEPAAAAAADGNEKPAQAEKPEHAAKTAKAHPAAHAKARKAGKAAKPAKKATVAKAKPKSAKKAAPKKAAKAKGKGK